MELQVYLRIIRRWFWLILLAMVIGGGLSFIINISRTPVYVAQSTVLIGQFINSPNPQYADILTGLDLATTYVELVETRNVLQRAIDDVGIELTPAVLRAMVNTNIVPDTSLINISVSYTDPVVAADLANALANQMISQSPTNLTSDQQLQINFLNNQISVLTIQVEELQNRLSELTTQISAATDLVEKERLTTERDTALGQFNLAQANIAQFASTIASLQQRINSVQVVETAEIPTQPVGTSMFSTVILGSMAAAIATIGLVLTIEFLDDTIRTTEDASQILALPILGAIVRFGTKNASYKDRLLSRFPPMSTVNEGYRTARTNILFSIEKDSKNVFIVTSASPQEGKTITTSNLAISMALSGMNVLLIDADLRRPKIHEAFNLENSIGLTTLLFCDPTQSIITPEEDPELAGLPKAFVDCIQQSEIAKLHVITSGFIPSNPTEILASTAMAKWIEVILSSQVIDIVLIDTPPALAAADASVLAANIKAKTILVVDRGATRYGAAKRVKAQFAQLKSSITGLILNRIDPRDENYGYYYGYYYTAEGQSVTPPKGLGRLFKRQPQ